MWFHDQQCFKDFFHKMLHKTAFGLLISAIFSKGVDDDSSMSKPFTVAQLSP